MKLLLDPIFERKQRLSNPKEAFRYFMTVPGEMFRKMPGRETLRVVIDGKPYFIKRHFGVGWKEIFKNLIQGRLPVLGARQEWNALQHLKKHNISTLQPLGLGEKGWCPAWRKSFLITAELNETQSIQELFACWRKGSPLFQKKQVLIERLAQQVAVLHQQGLNHRDCYLCHFRIPLKSDGQEQAFDGPLSVVDLHRAQIRKRVPLRWLIKDLAGLYFSTLEFCDQMTQRDYFRFMIHYTQAPLRKTLRDPLWKRVQQKGQRLYHQHRVRDHDNT